MVNRDVKKQGFDGVDDRAKYFRCTYHLRLSLGGGGTHKICMQAINLWK